MKRILLFLFWVPYVIISSCDLVQKNYEFFYYPALNVYYDVRNKMYLYSLDGGESWDSVVMATSAVPATLGNKEVIKSNTPDVWVNNKAHIQQYNGRLINIVTADTGANNQALAEERRIKRPKSSIVTTQPEKEPEKKPGFFKRLFGKKK